MFLFPRRLHPIPVRGRAHYSSFFSNKAGGGGRYVNSAKPSKPAVAPATAPTKDPSPSTSSAEANDGMNSSTSTSSTSHGSNGPHPNASEQSATTSNHSPSSHDPSPHVQTTSLPAPAPEFSAHHPLLYHPAVDSNDFKLHQFFALHRPLLLLSHPTSVIFDEPPTLPLTSPLASLSTNTGPDSDKPAALPVTLDNPPESSPEEDADAARQLARALVLNRVGGTVAWENTLRNLGLDLAQDEERVELKDQCDKEWEDVMMESTKRKKRSKMKRHKLKKRRRATRSQRLKIGR